MTTSPTTDQPDYVMVPREPTEAMLRAAQIVAVTMPPHPATNVLRTQWSAMIAAAPASPIPTATGDMGKTRLALEAIKAVTATTKDAVAGLSRIMAITHSAGVEAPYSDLMANPDVALIVNRPRTEWRHLFERADGCTIPPEGWTCSRTPGHDGPCAASPIPTSVNGAGEREDEVDRLAQFLHDEGNFGDAMPDRTWPEHPGDTGQREGGWVKIVPSDVQAHFRDVARRWLLPPVLSPALDNTAVEGLRAALEPVMHWYQSDEHEARPLFDIVTDVVADLQEDRKAALAKTTFTDEQIAAVAERFCATPLPDTLCADLVAIKPMAGRTGTNLMTVAEASQMLRAALIQAETAR